MIAIAALFTFYFLAKRSSIPNPPMVESDDLDPAITSVLKKRRAEVVQSPRSGETWGRLGTSFLAYEFRAEARQCFEVAEELDPNNPRWPYFHGMSQFPDATEAGLQKLRRAVELHRDRDASVRNRLATVLLDVAQLEEAERQFQLVLQRWPNDPTAVLGLSQVRIANGQLEESLDLLNRAAKDRHTKKRATEILAIVLRRLGRSDEADLAHSKSQTMPDDLSFPDPYLDEASDVRTGRQAWLDEANKLYRQNKIKEAYELVQRTVDRYPESGDAWILMGRVRMRMQQFDSAEKAWLNAIDRSPMAVEAHTQLGATRMHLQQLDKAIPSLQKAIELKPTLSEAFHNLGICYSGLNDTAQAITAFREAVRLRPGFVDSYIGLADALGRQGDQEEGKQVLSEALKLAPEDPRILNLKTTYGW